MAYLTKKRVKEILNNAPAGTTPAGIIAGLRQRGYELEGYAEVAKKINAPRMEELKQKMAAEAQEGAKQQKIIDNPLLQFKNTWAGDIGTGALKGLAEGVDFFGKVGNWAMNLENKGINKVAGTNLPTNQSGLIFGEEKTKADNAWQEIGKIASAFFPTPKITPFLKGASVGWTALKGATNVSKAGAKKVSVALTPMEKYVETALKETDMPTFQKYLEQGKKSVADIHFQTPMSMAGEEAQRALDIIKDQKEKAGQLLGKITKNVGKNPLQNEVLSVIDGMRKDIAQRFGVLIGKDGVIRTATNRRVNISKSDIVELQNAFRDLDSIIDKKKIYQAGNVLGGVSGRAVDSQTAILRTADDIISKIQKTLYQRRTNQGVYQLNDEVEGTIKFWLGKLNNAVKEVGGTDYKQAKENSAQLISLFNRFNKVLGERGKRGASLMKTIFSPTGDDTRKLLLEIKARTGIDLANRAVLAKFIMEATGDTRQKNLLEEVGFKSSSRDFITSIINKSFNLIKDPIGKSESIVKKANR